MKKEFYQSRLPHQDAKSPLTRIEKEMIIGKSEQSKVKNKLKISVKSKLPHTNELVSQFELNSFL